MRPELKKIVTHDSTDDCVACRSQDMVAQALLPAAAAWESAVGLPRYAIALHGAAGLLGIMMDEGVPRVEIEEAMAELLDDIEAQIAEDKAMGGPPQGTA